MSDDPTRELPKDGSFEGRMFAELAAIRGEFHGEFATVHSELAAIRADIAKLDARQEKCEGRLLVLGEKVDSRLKETRRFGSQCSMRSSAWI